jgi:hypothetical protein
MLGRRPSAALDGFSRALAHLPECGARRPVSAHRESFACAIGCGVVPQRTVLSCGHPIAHSGHALTLFPER